MKKSELREIIRNVIREELDNQEDDCLKCEGPGADSESGLCPACEKKGYYEEAGQIHGPDGQIIKTRISPK
jgi:uncharacterized paraquat-inducible protein A